MSIAAQHVFALVKKRIQTLNEQPSLPALWVTVILALLFVPQLVISYGIVQESVMTDLHSRVIGSRLMAQNLSPYFYIWHAGDPVNLYNPNSHLPYQLNGVTATPFFLWLQMPLSKLYYCNIKVVWWIIEEALLFATLLLNCTYADKRLKQMITLLMSVLFFCYSRNWWVHVNAGQYYILFAFLFSFTCWLTRHKENVGLFVYAFAALVRPFFVLAALPFLINKTPKKIAQILVVASTLLVLVWVSGGYRYLADYNSAMQLYGLQIFNWQMVNVPATLSAVSPITEGCVHAVESFNSYNAGCLFSLQHYLKLAGITLTTSWVYTLGLLLFIALFIIATGYKRIVHNSEHVFISSFLIYIFCELFTPAFRNPYNLMQYAAMVALVVNSGRLSTNILFFVGLALNHDLPFRFQYQREFGELLMLLSIYLLLFKKCGQSNGFAPFYRLT